MKRRDWQVFRFDDWNGDIEEDADGGIFCEAVSDLHPLERAIVYRSVPLALLVEAGSGLEVLELNLQRLEENESFFLQESAALMARNERRQDELRADPETFAYWGMRPDSAHAQCDRIAESLVALHHALDEMRIARNRVKTALRERIHMLEREARDALAASKELRREAMALDPSVVTRFHGRPYSVGES